MLKTEPKVSFSAWEEKGKQGAVQQVFLNQLWEIPNLVTCYRILSAIALFIFTFVTPRRWVVLVVYLTGLASDKIDGTLARWLKKETPLGLRLEPIADFMLVYAILLYLSFHTDFPTWLLWLATGVMVLGGFITIIRTLLGKKEYYVPNFPEAKFMVFLFHLTAVLFLFSLPFRFLALWLTIAGGVITFISYLVRLHYFHIEG